MQQEEFFDSIERPWRYDANVGVILAPARAGEGDGAHRYVTDVATGILKVVKNAHPTDTSVFQERRDTALERVMVLVRASREVEANASSPSPSSEDDEGDEDGEDGGAHCRRAPEPPPPRQRQRRVANDALAECTITTHIRPTTGRTDLTVVTPDGCTFRSKAAALRYLEGA